MYAVISLGDKQFLVKEGDVIQAPRRDAEEGSKIEISEVLAVGGDAGFKLGRPYVDGAQVTLELQKQAKGPKLIHFRFTRTDNSKRKQGHRQPISVLKVEKIRS